MCMPTLHMLHVQVLPICQGSATQAFHRKTTLAFTPTSLQTAGAASISHSMLHAATHSTMDMQVGAVLVAMLINSATITVPMKRKLSTVASGAEWEDLPAGEDEYSMLNDGEEWGGGLKLYGGRSADLSDVLQTAEQARLVVRHHPSSYIIV